MVALCREYLLGLSIELERRAKVAQDPSFANSSRGLELAALFTHAQMLPQHQTIALRQAMNQASKAGNFVMAASFANRLLELKPSEKVAAQVRCDGRGAAVDRELTDKLHLYLLGTASALALRSIAPR